MKYHKVISLIPFPVGFKPLDIVIQSRERLHICHLDVSHSPVRVFTAHLPNKWILKNTCLSTHTAPYRCADSPELLILIVLRFDGPVTQRDYVEGSQFT